MQVPSGGLRAAAGRAGPRMSIRDVAKTSLRREGDPWNMPDVFIIRGAGTMTDLSQWLSARNLGALEATLSENEIDLDILFDLTDDDMRELGLSLGARKRLRVALDAAASGETSAVEPARAGGAAERRHLTTMFVDLVGSTELSTGLDPEDMRDIITSYQNAVAGVVTRYEGQVAKYMGDGVLCYFGWPRAHEDDAKRAARAGLEIIEAMRGLRAPDGRELTVRIGVATGLVVVGDLIGEGAAQEEAVVGDTPNLAARLQAVAGPDQIVVADTTRQLLGADFEMAELGALELKGVGRPVAAWRVDAERSLVTRFEEGGLDPALPLIGRDHELGLIMERWRRARDGEGQVVVLNGEAGIGKSRLTRAAIDEIARGEHYRISYHCSPYHADSSFYPVIQQLTYAMGLSEADSASDKFAKLQENLRRADPRIIAEMLRIDMEAEMGPLGLTPQQVRNRILAETAEEVRALTQDKPVLIVVEDAHWIDASTLAMLEACLDRITGDRAMILITGRPSFVHGFGGHPIVSKLALNRLGAEQTADVLSRIAGGKDLPPELVAEITARTDGVPLFIEEMAKTILESGELRETETAYELSGPLSRVTIPATLHDSLMARIDRLQPIKEVAQMAACIGRHFDRAALERIARVDARTLDDALAQLEQSELVFRRGAPPDASYVFKHALVRDVAYQSLLKRRRQEIHARLVEVFEAEGAAPELVAHHATEAGQTAKAAGLWAEAGSLAQARPAYDEAANHLKVALAEAGRLLDDLVWRERELALLVQLAQVYIAKEGYASTEASEAFDKAMQRVAATESAELRVAIYYGAWIAPYIGNRLHRAYETANRLVDEMAEEADPVPRLISRRMRAATLISMGRSPEALEDLKAAYALYQEAEITDFSAKFAQDPGVQIWCYMQLAMWMCGNREGAWDVADRSMARARELNHANTFCYAALHDVMLAVWEGDVTRARNVTEEMRQIGTEHDMTLWKLFAGIFEAVIACMTDQPDGPARLDTALEAYRAAGCWLWAPLFLAEQARARLRAGDKAGAAAAVKRGLAEAEICGEHWAEPVLRQVLGDIRRAEGDLAGAAQAYKQAMAEARSQGAAPLLVQAEAALASL